MIAYRHAEDKYGVKLVIIPDTLDGIVDVDALENLITDRVKLISISHLPTNDGLINPAEAIGAIAAKHNKAYLLDACQSVGQMPVNVSKFQCTMLSATGRKFLRGPRGTGFLWVREDWIDRLNPPFLDNTAAKWTDVDKYEIASTAKRFENWESYVAGRIGLGIAAEYAMGVGLDNIWERIKSLSSRLRDGLEAIPGVRVHDQGVQKSGIVMFTKEGLAPGEIKRRLQEKHRINTSVSGVQLTRKTLIASGVTHLVRASPHAYNTEEEIDRLVEAVSEL